MNFANNYLANTGLEAGISYMALLAYGLASVFYVFSLQKGQRTPIAQKAGFYFFTLASIAETILFGLTFDSASTTELSSLLLAVTLSWFALMGQIRLQMRLIGAFVAPLCTLILLIKFFLAPPTNDIALGSEQALLGHTHILLSILGQAFAILACAASLLLFWQQSLLKRKLLTQMAQQDFPALDRMERFQLLCLWAGFIFLTLGLVTGAIYAQIHTPPPGMPLVIKVIWAIMVWLWYLVILLGRNIGSWSARRLAKLSLAGFVLLAVSYFGIGFLGVSG